MAERHPVPGITITGRNLRVRVTIPSVGGKLEDIITAALPGQPVSQVLTVLVLGRLSDGTDRAAFTVADPRPGAAITGTDYTTHGQYVAPGEDYTSPAAGDLDSYVKAASDSPAVVVLFW
jgi:hypothetical protein